MESELVFTLPMGIFMLVVLSRRPLGEFFGPIKERRREHRREDKRMKRFRRQGCSLESSELDEPESDKKRRSLDRRDESTEKRRRDRRALERIKRV